MNVTELIARLPGIGMTGEALGVGTPYRDHRCIDPVPETDLWMVYEFDGGRGPSSVRRIFEDESTACWYLFGALSIDSSRAGTLGPRGGQGPVVMHDLGGRAGPFVKGLQRSGLPVFDPLEPNPGSWHIEPEREHWRVSYLGEDGSPVRTATMQSERVAYDYVFGHIIAEEVDAGRVAALVARPAVEGTR